ncbi:DUF6247 family protein [Streptomyces sp. NPDC045456]|uniref:DUF6247 family protein n=1 Tax=Streptomyces sp. NPDC045456 TaxID=3155254 RepID=UPI0033F76DE0
MSAQPVEPHGEPLPPPGAAASIRTQIQQAPERERWEPAFERDWRHALEDARETGSLTPAHRVIRTWQARLATAPAVRVFKASGCDDSDGVPSEQILGPRP